MSNTSAHAPSPQACRPADQTQCSTCMLSYDCRSTSRQGFIAWPLVVLGALLAVGGVLRVAGLM